MSFLKKLVKGLSKSASKLGGGIESLFTGKRKIDDALLEEIEESLILADCGTDLAASLVDDLRKTRFGSEVTGEEVRAFLAERMGELLAPAIQTLPPAPPSADNPLAILVVGVNGSGKTTSIGKLVHYYQDQGAKPIIIAGDSFRAAAVEQLAIWAQRTNTPLVTGAPGCDAAGLAFDGAQEAKKQNANVIIMDTAGRLQTRSDLMAELAKIKRSLGKALPETPLQVWLILDATTGQNALLQVKAFQEIVDVSGLILTKLDGTARGGVLLAIVKETGLPVIAAGVGEGLEDLRPFNGDDYAKALLGLI